MLSDEPVRVLLVEDSVAEAELVSDALALERRPRFLVERAARVEEATHALQAAGFDVVLLDLGLPDAAGLDALAAIQASGAGVAIVVRTGLADREVALAAIEAGAQDYIIKGASTGEETLKRSILYALARRAAEETSRRLAAIVESSNDAIIGKALDGTITSWNSGAQRMYGYRAHEALGQPSAILAVSTEHDLDFRETLSRVARGEVVPPVETVRRRKDGRVLDVSLTVSPIRDARGEVIGVSTVARDISELKQLHRHLRAIFDHVPAGLALRDVDGRYLQVNSYEAGVLGKTPRELLGLRPGDHLDPAVVAQMQAGEREMLASRGPVTHELTVAHADGSDHHYHTVRYPIVDERGIVSAFGSFSLDVTDRRRAEREREQALAALQDAQQIAHVGSWWWDPARDEAGWSEETYRIFGRDQALGPVVSEQFFAYVHPDDRRRIVDGYARMFGGGPAFELEYRLLGAEGKEKVVHGIGRRDDARGVYVGTIQDVTELRAAERAVREAEQRFRRAFDDAPIGMALVSMSGRIEQANTALGRICGRTVTELELHPLTDLVHPGDRAEIAAAQEALAGGRSDQLAVRTRFVPPAGASVDVSVHATPLRDDAGSPQQLLYQFEDVTARRRFEEQLQFMAEHDPLTGLVNRRKFEERLQRHLVHVKRYGPEGALLVLDIDHFKQVNDTLGHTAGDELLVSVAGLLRERLRESDVIARFGGDEFAVLLPKGDEAQAMHVARALVLAVRAGSTRLNRERKHITTSIGVTMFDTRPDRLSAEAVLIEADLAMYDAKEAGRDGFAFYDPTQHRPVRGEARMAWATRIEHALEHDRLALVAQPIVDLRTGQVHHHELLVRMIGERGDLIPPATFLYVAERFGLVSRLDEWVTGRAVELLDRHPAQQLAINISGRSLGDQRLLGAIERRLRETPIDPSRLIFEVTETAAVANITRAQSFARHLRELGCQFALDDFGAGFGSFYYLKHLPFDYVKIDGEFIRHAVAGRIDRLVIEAVVGIARGLGKETIAEFVTDEKTRETVARLGVDHAQGHHIGRPIPVEELLWGAELSAPPSR